MIGKAFMVKGVKQSTAGGETKGKGLEGGVGKRTGAILRSDNSIGGEEVAGIVDRIPRLQTSVMCFEKEI